MATPAYYVGNLKPTAPQLVNDYLIPAVDGVLGALIGQAASETTLDFLVNKAGLATTFTLRI